MLKMPKFLAKMAQDLAKKTTCAFISCPGKLFQGLIKVVPTVQSCSNASLTTKQEKIISLIKTKLTPYVKKLRARKHTLFLDIMAD